MGMTSKIAAGLFALALTGQAFSCDIHGVTGIVEDNNMFIPVGAKNAGGITQEQFNTTLDRVEAIYRPIIEAKGKKLQVERNWSDGTVNAYAQQRGNLWKISMFGGLARHEVITQDAFATVACHELGHHLGGLPKKRSWMGNSWASNEGQSDYFATSKCLRKYFETENSQDIIANMEVPAIVKQKCESNFTNGEEVARCIRGSLAGLSLANLFKALRRSEDELKYDTPDPRVVTSTNDNHPASQCRLDTYFQGAICSIDAYQDVSDSDVNEGVCSRIERHDDGLRPRCWFAPPRS